MHTADDNNNKKAMSQSLSSVQVCYRVRKGAEEAFDCWLRELSWCEMNAEGNLGVAIKRRLVSGRLEYHVESCFRSEAHLQRWLDSEQRQDSLSKLPKITSRSPRIQRGDPETSTLVAGLQRQTRLSLFSKPLVSLVARLAF